MVNFLHVWTQLVGTLWYIKLKPILLYLLLFIPFIVGFYVSSLKLDSAMMHVGIQLIESLIYCCTKPSLVLQMSHNLFCI